MTFEESVMRDLARLPRVDEDEDLVKEHDRLVQESLLCSFCGKSERQVAHILRGHGVYICNECVTVAVEEIERLESEPGRADS
jgi:hypothetical protein